MIKFNEYAALLTLWMWLYIPYLIRTISQPLTPQVESMGIFLTLITYILIGIGGIILKMN